MLKKDLKEQADIASTTLAKMGKGEAVSMEVLWRICQTLNVNVGDIVEFIFPKK
jgi:DNA-binding Xre family transcriptional regulator